uniref:Electron transport complex protein RnfG n=1 Tax=Candidatus Kentrum sp. MB TaxID=2138164 RepID=A0A451BAB2_9GAMM|nr:MAG: electron transport complex protein RnfG [Candidatus Kentron sp. MB]VFK30431.1 MAG: electron transport complex protein RnfG [Candidatus Kentron sp. MB]VFK75218.1 MAG: electron transport complex protein RnfG [Candidatus Kentron sp. MB]
MSEVQQLKESGEHSEVQVHEVVEGEHVPDGKSNSASDLPSGITPIMPSSASMILVLGLIAMFSGILVVLVYDYTAPIIKEKERLALEAAVFQVIPDVDVGAARQIGFSLTSSDGLVEVDEKTTLPANLYAVYDSTDALLGFAMEGAAQGYQDIVRTLFGYKVDCECIVGMTVLKSVDTPGLGDKGTVEKNKGFMANFRQLDVSLNESKDAVMHSIETVKQGTKTEDWQVDAMSGATITSRAIAKGIDNTVGKMLPLVVKNLAAIRLAAKK